MNPKVLAVDDDEMILNAMRTAFNGSRYELDTAKDANECLRLIRQNPLRYAVVFVDYNLAATPSNGTQRGDFVARRLKEINSNITVIIVSGDRTPEAFSAWITAGVDQFLYKPFQTHQVLAIAENGCARFEAQFGSSSCEVTIQKNSEAAEALRKVGLVSISPAMGRAAQLAITLSKNTYNVLILGETGTGKEMIAQAMHSLSDQNRKPFLPINCSTYKNDENLLESELFGHEKGSFTGADRQKLGIFEAAQGGVVFLDEIHHLGPNAQAKLLRVIQERKVRRVGGNVEIPVRFRLITAGKPELKEMVHTGLFSGDLYYRVKEMLIELPSLRERRKDIDLLLRHFKAKYGHDLGRAVEFTDGVYETLEQYEWPGNVRELSNLVKSLLITVSSSRHVIHVEDLPAEFTSGASSRIVPFNLLVAKQELQQRDLLLRALNETGNNVSRAAARLEIARSTMRDLMKKFKIEEAVQEARGKRVAPDTASKNML